MPFQKGHKLAKGGARPNSGPLKKSEAEIRDAFIKAYWQAVAKQQAQVITRFMADDVAPREIVKQLIPYVRPEMEQDHQATYNTTFIQFNQHNNTVQLPAEAVSATVLVGNGRGEEASSEGVAPAQWQRQNGSELYDRPDVPGEWGEDRDVLPSVPDVCSGEEDNLGRDRRTGIQGDRSLPGTVRKKQE